MRPSPCKLRPAVKWHGGKFYLARRIIRTFPPHRVYVEPFAGGANVLLNKPRSAVEVLGDVDAGLMAFYRVLRDRTAELAEALEDLPYSEASFAWARDATPADPVEAAAAFLVRNRMSRGGLGSEFATSERSRGGRPGDVNAWETFRHGELPRIARRLRGVELVTTPAVATIRRFDADDALFYSDPPYVPTTRTVRDAYRHELAEADHHAVLDVLASCCGTVVLSGYPSPLYDERLAGWDRVEFDMPNHAGQGKAKQRRTEVLWIKPAAVWSLV